MPLRVRHPWTAIRQKHPETITRHHEHGDVDTALGKRFAKMNQVDHD